MAATPDSTRLNLLVLPEGQAEKRMHLALPEHRPHIELDASRASTDKFPKDSAALPYSAGSPEASDGALRRMGSASSRLPLGWEATPTLATPPQAAGDPSRSPHAVTADKVISQLEELVSQTVRQREHMSGCVRQSLEELESLVVKASGSSSSSRVFQERQARQTLELPRTASSVLRCPSQRGASPMWREAQPRTHPQMQPHASPQARMASISPGPQARMVSLSPARSQARMVSHSPRRSQANVLCASPALRSSTPRPDRGHRALDAPLHTASRWRFPEPVPRPWHAPDAPAAASRAAQPMGHGQRGPDPGHVSVHAVPHEAQLFGVPLRLGACGSEPLAVDATRAQTPPGRHCQPLPALGASPLPHVPLAPCAAPLFSLSPAVSWAAPGQPQASEALRVAWTSPTSNGWMSQC